MLLAALRDLQWRRRRFIIGIVGTGVVFAMTLVLTGLSNGFRVEAENTVDSLGIDSYLIKAGAAGPFLGASPLPAADVPLVARMPGVMAAAPLVYAATTADDGGTPRNVNVFGAPDQGPGMPAVAEGRAPSSPDEIAVSSTLDRAVGGDLLINSRTLRVVGIVDDSTVLAGQPVVFLTTAGAQELVFSRSAAGVVDRYPGHARGGARRVPRCRPRRRGG